MKRSNVKSRKAPKLTQSVRIANVNRSAKPVDINIKSFIVGNSPALLKEINKNYSSNSRRQFNTDTLPSRIEHMVKSGGGVTSFDLERIIGSNDMVRINYLERGISASKTVCRIYVFDPQTSDRWWGTGFLISPNLLLTNNHVLANETLAANAFAEFGYEADLNGVLKQGKRFRLAPAKGFITSDQNKLDFSIVAIESVADDGFTRLSDYGYLRLDPNLHKVDELEYVTVIQHPNGGEKLIAIRENKVVKLGDTKDAKQNNFLWYASDTAPGSSGAPVFNDSWQVVAVHHSGGLLNDTTKQYETNEGIRISSLVNESIKLYNALTSKQKMASSFLRQFIDDATGIKPFPNSRIGSSIVDTNVVRERVVTDPFEEKAKTAVKNIHSAEFFNGRRGYNEDFLGVTIPLPEITSKALEFGQPAELLNAPGIELKYTHFSVVHNAARKIAFFTASNIDGRKWKNLAREGDKWWFDARIPMNLQLDDRLYGNEPVNGNKGWFDRGHLVRRLDPVWGSEAEANQANEDTFHWTNCSPQYWGFNQGQELWQGLENYLLYNTDKEDIKSCIFSGPVFGDDDEAHRGVLIPQYFWKLIVLTDSNDKVYASAYRVSQKKYAKDIPFEVIPVGDFNHFQITVKKLESMTGLRFADVIRDHDVIKGQAGDRPLRSLADIKMPRRR